ncbi:MAG: hypothetical protein P4L55_22265 [Syntrophobacteraceae bacterium]|nr:hypothetical protein [Syntrophobacteraceae bacterium]
MRTANLLKYSFRLFSVLCVICLFECPISAGAQNFDFSGTWQFNSMLSGPGAPWWERGTLSVAQDQTFTGSGTQSNGASDTPSGSFSVNSNGISMSLNGKFSTSLCMTDSTDSTITCTATLADTSSELIVLTQQSTSTTLANLAGTWKGGSLASGPTSAWEQVSQTINSDGTFTGTYTKSDGTTGSTSGTLAISQDGVVTCASGACTDPTFASVVNPTATVMVGTSGAATSTRDATLTVLTRQTNATYSLANLVGIWELSSLASGPGAPWWQGGLLFINQNGTCTLSSLTSASTSGTASTQNGTVAISSAGLITLKLGPTTAQGVVDPNMDVMVLTSTWADGATHQISTLLNASSASLGGGTTATWSTGNTSSGYGGYPTSTGDSSTPQSSTPSKATSSSKSGQTGQTAGGAQTGSSGAMAGSSEPESSSTAAAAQAAAPAAAPAALPSSTQASVPAAPTIVVVTPGNSQALVNFKLPASDGGQRITQCIVTANPGGIKTARAGSPIRVSELQNGTPYTFEVTAANSVGAGPPSQASQSITPGKVPDAPQIQAVKAGSGQAEISFKAPASNGGSNITSYTVTASSGQKSSGLSSPITVKGLPARKPCTFTVTATNGSGTSAPSHTSQSVTPH